jgi:hypothetical protein
MANIRHEGTLRVLDVSPLRNGSHLTVTDEADSITFGIELDSRGVHVSMSVRVGPADLDALEREIAAIRERRGI